MQSDVRTARQYRERLHHPEFQPIPEDVWQLTVPEIIAWRARQQPGALAVTDGTTAYTYGELEVASNRLAHALLEAFPNPGDRVPILLGRRAIILVAMLASMKAGREFATLESSFPIDQLNQILAALGSPALVTNSGHFAIAQQLPLPLLDVDDALAGGRLPDTTPNIPLTMEGNYSIVFTSGSTGASKGVLVSKRGRRYGIRRSIELDRLGPYDRYAHLGNPNFAGPQISLTALLASGAATYLADIAELGISGIGHWLQKNAITIFHATTGVFRESGLEIRAARLDSLRLVRVGAEKRSRSDLEILRENYPAHTWMAFGFGASETGSIARAYLNAADEPEGDMLPAGYINPPEEVLIVREDGSILPPGQEGEILIATPQISPGYFNNETLTAEKFIPHPADPARRMYRTGDMGWLTGEGLLYVTGRRDFQVKLRGMNVNMQEVSATLLLHPQVRDAAVTAHTDSHGAKRLVGYVVGNEDALTVAALREFLGGSLAAFKIPAYFIFLETLPKLPNGKVNYRGLPAPDGQRPALSSAFVPPSGPLEASLIQIWQDVLGLHPLGVEDDFHELGGDSLQAARIFVDVEKRLGYKLAPAVLYTASTVRQLASTLVAEKNIRHDHDGLWLTPIQRGRRLKPTLFFLTPIRGDAMAYQHIIQNLSPDLTLFAINTWRMTVRQQRKMTLEDLAAKCVALMLSVDPEGPYVLGGHSFAGLLAYEAAHQLILAGKRVQFVWLGDTFGPNPPPDRLLVGRRGRLRQELATMPPAVRLQFILGRILRSGTYVRRLRGMLARRLRLPSLMPDPLQVGGTGFRRPYILPRQDVRVLLFRSDRRKSAAGEDDSLGWNRVVARGVEIQRVPGNHMTILHNEGAAAIAEGIMSALEARLPG